MICTSSVQWLPIVQSRTRYICWLYTVHMHGGGREHNFLNICRLTHASTDKQTRPLCSLVHRSLTTPKDHYPIWASADFPPSIHQIHSSMFPILQSRTPFQIIAVVRSANRSHNIWLKINCSFLFPGLAPPPPLLCPVSSLFHAKSVLLPLPRPLFHALFISAELAKDKVKGYPPFTHPNRSKDFCPSTL